MFERGRSIRQLVFVVLALAAWLPSVVAAQRDLTAADAIGGHLDPEPGEPRAMSDGHRRRIVAELVTGGGLVAFSGLGWIGEGSSDRGADTMLILSPTAAAIGSFELFHGAARLRVHRSLARGMAIDELRGRERRRGRRHLGVGSIVFASGAVIAGVTPIFAAGDQGAAIVLAPTFGGMIGASGLFLMEHGIYRVHFGRRGSLDGLVLGPDVRVASDGVVVGVRGAL